jgi:hypothetical protein
MAFLLIINHILDNTANTNKSLLQQVLADLKPQDPGKNNSLSETTQSKISSKTVSRIFCWHEANFISFFIQAFELVTSGISYPGWLQTTIILISASRVPTVNWKKACWTDMHEEIDKETEMLDWKQHENGSLPQHMLHWEKNCKKFYIHSWKKVYYLYSPS